MAISYRNIFLFAVIVSVCGCSLVEPEPDPMFTRLSAADTGIHFSNDITYSREFSVMDYSYFYNGGGVAVGDINNDDLPDLYFTGNQVSSRLYLNKGNLKFEDITEASGTDTEHWTGGVAMVDINNDGYLDIYVSITGSENSTPEERTNLLFINNHDNTFTEAADQFGLADTGYTTHAAFFDYDRDGDLDVYLMNNFAGSFSRDNKTGIRPEINDGTSESTDVLYQNNGNGTFTDVSGKAGILKEGYSLGIAINDINRDGWPDVYVSNDILTDDLLYVNNGDGTFTDKAEDYFKHTSYAGMGADVADFNNDGWPDIVQVDMMPPKLQDQQLVTGAKDYEYLQKLKQKGYQTQYTINTLQLSNGIDRQGNIIFSEIGQLAGVAYTDWSWSGLFGDYDNDGYKDIMITNGYPKALNSFDYLRELNSASMFGTDSTRIEREYEIMDRLHDLKVPNYLYKNGRDLTFADVSSEWGFTEPTFSYGAVHADLDGDGDLDIAINNIDNAAGIYKNKADSLLGNHFLTLKLNGDSLNRGGIGSRIVLTVGGKKQHAYFSPYRGYQSTTDHKVYFGLGDEKVVDSVEVIWPDGRYSLYEEVPTNQVFTVEYGHSSKKIIELAKENHSSNLHFTNIVKELGIDYKHKENDYVDFDKEPLLPYMLSRTGPPLAVGDVNNDRYEDFYIGGAAGQPGILFIQREDGTFERSIESQPWKSDASYEDTGAVFFDANGNGLVDLYVVSGGNMFSPASNHLQDRLYLNTGGGNYIRAEDTLPRMLTSGSVVKTSDYDGDGDLDLFVGGRLVPGRYPLSAKSYILRNDDGKFTNITADVAPDLVEPGLITDAEWVDFNRDGATDLITTGMWMPVSFYENANGIFQNVTHSTGLAEQVGWWNSIASGDIDNDGDIDLVAGNMGLNYRYSMSGHPPLDMFVNDFDENQSIDAILALKNGDKHYILHGMGSMIKQLPKHMRRVQSFKGYANLSLERLVGKRKIEEAAHYRANSFASSLILNEGDGSFKIKPLPNEAQISSVNDIIVEDINGDANLDLIIAGNIYDTHPQATRSDAGNGLILLGDGEGEFTPVSPYKSDFLTPGKVRNLALITIAKGQVVLVGSNNSLLQAYKVHSINKHSIGYK